MDFINAPIDVKALPALEHISLRPVHPSYKKILQIEWFITTIVLSLIAAAIIFTSASVRNSYVWLIILSLVVLFCSFYYIGIQKSFPFLSYAVREKDVIHQKGWIIRQIKTCPFNRIQNCSVQSGPLERKYRLASLTIYTAGTNGADMRISGLLQEEAEKLRHFILHKIHT
jgi:membrane protein YdbS with pleckstrin-like domain